jgi:hypothetical protein
VAYSSSIQCHQIGSVIALWSDEGSGESGNEAEVAKTNLSTGLMMLALLSGSELPPWFTRDLGVI